MTEPTFEFCDYSNPVHLEALGVLLNHYMEDPMGDHAPLSVSEQQVLVEELAKRPHAFILFLLLNDSYVGMATCFELFSTFQVKPYLYIHDVVIHKTLRGRRLGRKLIERLILLSRERDYCKVTLEVREDNPSALSLYKSLGFEDCDPKMFFWTKQL